jgi:putative ABC transport system permease protein
MQLDTRWRKAWRDLGRHRARSLLVAAAMALALTGAGIMLNAWALIERATDAGYRASLPVSATITVDGSIDAATLAQVRELPTVGAARLRRTWTLSAKAEGAWQNAVFYAFDDFNAPGLGRLKPEGPWPPPEGQWVIERSSLDFAGATVGGAVSLRRPGAEPQTMTVAGLVRDVSLAPGWMDHVVYGYATSTTLQRLGAPPGFDELQLRVRDDHADHAAIRRIAAEAAAVLERHGLRITDIDVPEPGVHVHAAQMNSMLMTQGAFGVLALVVCSFLVVNLIHAMLAGQAREIAVMKTLGATPAVIARLYLVQALLLGLLAALPALPAALLVARRYAAFKAEMLNFPFDGHWVPWGSLALQLLVALALPVAAAAWPVRRACRVPVGESLRDIGIVAPGRALASTRRVRFGGWPRPLLLALGNAFRRRQRMVLTLLALAVGSAVHLGAANLRGAVIASTDLLFDGQRYDASLRLMDPQPAARLEAAARAVEGVAEAEAWRGRRAVLADSGESIRLIGVPDDTAMLRPNLAQGRWLAAADGDSVVVSRGLLRRHPQWQVGQAISLRIDGAVRPWTIVGLINTGPQPVAYTRRARLDALAGDTLAGSLVVAFDGARSDAAQLDGIARLRNALAEAGMPVASSQRAVEGRRSYEDHLLLVVQFLGAMGWLMVGVGAISLASTMGLAVLERRRELGVMRAIGARDGVTMAMVQVEGLVITLLAWLAALPLSVPMSLLLAYTFGRVMFPLPAPWWPDLAAALRWLLVMVPVSLVACAWPAWRAARVPVATSLAYDG